MSTPKQRADTVATAVMLAVITIATIALGAAEGIALPGRIAIAVGLGLLAAIVTRAVLARRASARDRVSGSGPDRPSPHG
ncbi:hypothetical protein OVA14_06970 [Agrococcus sp. SL85]|uniref:hypothetical protein n=1 Tax=Agrococcus sp. SL85 TaxID=2995141 RepID=UPI00226C974E|nr:hypothetical protein [Agrococcus sp. SL85]WAC65137.1 hypothetical protein OVA14_06970 [Agrococcus sp. SL85]